MMVSLLNCRPRRDCFNADSCIYDSEALFFRQSKDRIQVEFPDLGNLFNEARETQQHLFVSERRKNQRGRESLLAASSARAFSSSPGLLSWSVELRSLKGYRFGEDLWIAHAREIGHSYSRPAGSATD